MKVALYFLIDFNRSERDVLDSHVPNWRSISAKSQYYSYVDLKKLKRMIGKKIDSKKGAPDVMAQIWNRLAVASS